MKPTETVRAFVDAINSQSIDVMVSMMTPDHTFTDSLGKVIPTRRAMRDAWLGFFDMVPDYRVEVDQVFDDGDTVVVVGQAKGTFSKDGSLLKQNEWQVPAAWRATVVGHRIRAWQAFVDNDPLRRIMRFCGVLDD